MATIAHDLHAVSPHPVDIVVLPAAAPRNRLTVAFRPILAIPHLLLVGGPIAIGIGSLSQSGSGSSYEWSASGGVFGAAASVAALITWFAILFTGHQPDGLFSFSALYLRWRVRATAYMTLLSDEYPPFGDGPYPASLVLDPPDMPRDKLSVAFRCLLVLPHLLALCVLSLGWCVTTIIAWFAILFSGRYPASLEPFSIGVLRWSTRVEAYVLLLRDEYPPFRLGA